MVIKHIGDNVQAESFYGDDLWDTAVLSQRIRDSIEQHFVQAVDQMMSPLLLHIILSVMEDVEWEDVALSTREMIREQRQRMAELAGKQSARSTLTTYDINSEEGQRLWKSIQEN
jgi:siroheme synthase (precorrin-2 oxidase/ferrochelatase)